MDLAVLWEWCNELPGTSLGCARSLGSTVRRLSDVREDEAPMDFDMPAGDLDALLPNLPEAEEPAPHNPGTAPLTTSTHALHNTAQFCARICWRDIFCLAEDILVFRVAGTVS